VVEQEQIEAVGLTRQDIDRGDATRGESAVAFAAMVLAAVLVLVGLILLVARFTAPRRFAPVKLDVASLEKSRERIFVERAGEVGFLLRSAGPGPTGKWKREAEARALALDPDYVVLRMDAFNFSGEPVTLVDGPFVVRIAGAEIRPLPVKGETDPASPLYAALAGGDAAAELPPHSSRRIGLIGLGSAFDQGESAAVRRGKIAEDVVLTPRQVTERELAKFDREPALSGLESLIAASKPAEPQR
jgi:hypothetical protein